MLMGWADDICMTRLDAARLDRVGPIAFGVAAVLLALTGCTSSASPAPTAPAQTTGSALGSSPAVAVKLDASQAAAAREFGALMAQGDALGDAPNPQSSAGVGANDAANAAASEVLITKAIVVLKSVTWPSIVAPDVQAWIAGVTKAEAEIAAFTAFPAASKTAGPGASALAATINDLTAWSNAEARLRADFGLPPEESAPPSQ
jgi:hypothetical protein